MEKTLDLILSELQSLNNRITDIENSLATKQDFQAVHSKLDQLSEKIEVQHIENINADNLLLNKVRSLHEGVVFVNRKIADTELEVIGSR